MPSKKSKTPMTGAQRFAKYAAKMTEANQEQWSSKMKEERANYLARRSEQQKDAMRKRDKERKKACSLMAPLGGFLFYLSEIIILHAPKFCHLPQGFQNCFCFCSATFSSNVGTIFRLQWEFQW